jgi:hypothetical protein
MEGGHMSETQEGHTPEESKFRISIQITENLDGSLGLQVLGQAVKLVECRKMLSWALSRVNDEITAEIVRNLMEEKVKANGFRKFSLRGMMGK